MKVAFLAASMVWLASTPAAQPQPVPPATRLTLVTVVQHAEDTTVVVQGDGELGAPQIGVAEDGPPRVYLDFPGVLPADHGAAGQGSTSVRRVRVALHSDNPRVTRVVVDLFRATPHRVEDTAGDRTRVVLTFATATTDSAARARPAELRPRDSAVRPSVVVPAADAVAVVGRLEKLRPLLKAIDARSLESGVNLQLAAAELDSIARDAASLKPGNRSPAIKDRLVQACGLALQAVKARMESEASGNAALGANAVSAAAGALILLDSTRAALGLPLASPGA